MTTVTEMTEPLNTFEMELSECNVFFAVCRYRGNRNWFAGIGGNDKGELLRIYQNDPSIKEIRIYRVKLPMLSREEFEKEQP